MSSIMFPVLILLGVAGPLVLVWIFLREEGKEEKRVGEVITGANAGYDAVTALAIIAYAIMACFFLYAILMGIDLWWQWVPSLWFL